MFEDIYEQTQVRMQGITKTWIESNKRLLQQYRQMLERQMAEDPWAGTIQEMMRLAMSSVMQAAAFQRDAQRSLLETHVAMTERHLAMLEEMERTMGTSGAAASGTGSGDEKSEPSAA